MLTRTNIRATPENLMKIKPEYQRVDKSQCTQLRIFNTIKLRRLTKILTIEIKPKIPRASFVGNIDFQTFNIPLRGQIGYRSNQANSILPISNLISLLPTFRYFFPAQSLNLFILWWENDASSMDIKFGKMSLYYFLLSHLIIKIDQWNRYIYIYIYGKSV